MPLPLLAAVAFCFLAANSLLTRAGVLDGTDPLAFAAIRVGAGAVVLAALAARRGITLGGGRRWGAALALAIYLLGFSLAYRSLDAGLGALILFACVQLGLFAIGLARGEGTSARALLGMALALGGLTWLLWPEEGASADPLDAGLMAVAGLAWAGYSLAGRFEPRPLAGSASNFLLAAGMFALAAPVWLGAPVTAFGALMAVLSGAVASGLGYAMLFRVLPAMGSATAGLAQLSVPVIAMIAGAALLGELPTVQTVGAAALVLAGIAVATLPIGRAGS
ncbi:DMT family transporter [Jannaschia seohaensis]|uniref:EamA-like transporter family protein n=1 Tax=Jannaschia seohaensis TaxID=475081 RepID=A0A2Y9C2R5_9RHOB|nr:DMT family transporter [Jannaschia seohaensis]PWJ14437.1 EamA-like transporter family protein [Jannaschia seohaensis]SSA50172.1 EamA-like transporter family protein [Jannaschia seohaensis]